MLVLPHTAGFIDQARAALDMMPPANHLDDWRLLLDDLEHAATACRRILDIEPAAGDEKAHRAQDAALWPYVTTWAEHGYLVDSLVNQLHPVAPAPVPSDAEQRQIAQQVHAARSHGRLDIVRTWWDTAGRLISLIRIEGRNPLLALAGDLDSPGLEILGRFDDEDEAISACPHAAPAGVLRPDVSSADTIPPIQTTVPDLTQWVIEARVGVDVGIALLAVTDADDAALPGVRTLLDTAGEYAAATQTHQGAHLAARLEGLSSRLHAISRELHEVGHEMMNANAVLPPHRTPLPRHLPPQRADDRPHPRPVNAEHMSAPAAPPGPVSDTRPAPGTRRRS